jgi:phosphoglucosamine mutase
MSRLFGTDGVRGVANVKLTPELAVQLGRAAGRWLSQTGAPMRCVVGRDTRRSGPMLGAAFASGLCSAGVDVVTLGVAPTGAVSWVARTGEFGLAAVVSASHNPAPDNGIKLIGGDGRKLADEAERWVEGNLDPSNGDRPTGASLGDLRSDRSSLDAYADWLVTLVPERLDGLRVAMDAGHGAAFEIAPQVFRRLGAEVVAVGTEPDGTNINAVGGATKPGTVQALTTAMDAVIGVAFDGDADRAVFSDAKGRLINGDRTMAIWGAHWRADLEPSVIVGTVMSNGGFEAYLRGQGIHLERTDVGDKHVSAKLRELGGKVGGEQSGHIVFTERGPTGDGLVTALEVLRVLRRTGRTAAEVFGDYEAWPQSLVNVEVADMAGWKDRPAVKDAVARAEEALTGRGRLNVRASGTQPILRIMVEADDAALRDRVSDGLVSVILAECGGHVYGRVDLTHALGD